MTEQFLCFVLSACAIAGAPADHDVRSHSPSRQVTGASQVPFTEEAQARGINYTPDEFVWGGHGMTFADLDNDGDPDLVTIGAEDGTLGIFDNDGAGAFTDRFATTGIPTVTHASAVIAADYDRDGDLDLFIGRKLGSADMLLRNDGDFQFSDVSVLAGFTDPDTRSAGCAWGDYDGDGWLDLYLANNEGPNQLYHNLGDGSFEQVAVAMGVDLGDDPTLQPVFFDFDHDGDPDLYVGNDKGQGCVDYQNHLFENVGGTFEEITEVSGTEACVGNMGLGIGDFDGNGYQDVYCTNCPPGNVLLMNAGDGTFSHQEVETETQSFATGWAAHFFDYDNDGVLDLYVCNSDAPNRLYRHQGAWPCEEIAAEMGVDVGNWSYTMAVADIDDDGDLDMAVANYFEPVRLFINNEGQNRRWIKFDVVGTGPMHYAIGANVNVRTGETWRLREVIAGSNYKSQNELRIHVGVNDALIVDEVTVHWSGGLMRTLLSLPTNLTWTLYPPDKLGDADQDGDRQLDDFIVFAACFDAPVTPGCEMMDYDGSGLVDIDDFASFLAEYDDAPIDCNDNQVLDLEEILLDPQLDLDGDGMLDSCACPADADGDGEVDVADLLALLAAWGTDPGGPPDVDGDGDVDVADLLALIAAWGACG